MATTRWRRRSKRGSTIAAIRESREETGIEMEQNHLKIVGSVFKASEDYLFLIYEYAEPVDERANYTVEDEEIEAFRFVPINEVSTLLPKYYTSFWDAYTQAKS